MPNWRAAIPPVTRGLDPRVHLLRENFCQQDGLHRNAGLPELRNIMRWKSRLPVSSPAMTRSQIRALVARALRDYSMTSSCAPKHREQ